MLRVLQVIRPVKARSSVNDVDENPLFIRSGQPSRELRRPADEGKAMDVEGVAGNPAGEGKIVCE